MFGRKITEHELFILNDFKKETEPLLRLTYSDKAQIKRQDFYEVDYLSLRDLKDGEDLSFDDEQPNADFWFVPDYCVETDEGSQRSKEVNLPVRYEFMLHKIEREQSKTFSLKVGQDKLIALSGLRANQQSVLNLSRGHQYDLGPASCHKHFNGQYQDLEQYGDLLEIWYKLESVRASDYVGLRSCRDMDCDAYSFYSASNSLEDILRGARANEEQANERALQGEENSAGNDNDVKQEPVGRTLFTFYLRAGDSTAFQQLVQVKKQLFVGGTNNVSFNSINNSH